MDTVPGKQNTRIQFLVNRIQEYSSRLTEYKNTVPGKQNQKYMNAFKEAYTYRTFIRENSLENKRINLCLYF